MAKVGEEESEDDETGKNDGERGGDQRRREVCWVCVCIVWRIPLRARER